MRTESDYNIFDEEDNINRNSPYNTPNTNPNNNPTTASTTNSPNNTTTNNSNNANSPPNDLNNNATNTRNNTPPVNNENVSINSPPTPRTPVSTRNEDDVTGVATAPEGALEPHRPHGTISFCLLSLSLLSLRIPCRSRRCVITSILSFSFVPLVFFFFFLS